jgi:hypothetical protein
VTHAAVSKLATFICLGAFGSSAALGLAGERGSFSLKGCFGEVHGPDAKTVTLREDGIRTLEEAITALRPASAGI